jgi:hypothetical protein
MLELDPFGLRNIDLEQLFTAETIVLMLQEIAPLSRGVVDAKAATATLDLARARATMRIEVGEAAREITVAYSGSRLDPKDLVARLNALMALAGASRRYGLFDTAGEDMEIACLEPHEWGRISADGFLPTIS